MPAHPPTISRLSTEPAADLVSIPTGGTGFAWFERPSVPRALPRDPAVLEHGGRVLRLVLEVLARRRPIAQLAPLASPQPCRYAARQPSVAFVGPIRMCQPHSDAAEFSVTYRHGCYIGALAARFDRLTTPAPIRWQLNALRLG